MRFRVQFPALARIRFVCLLVLLLLRVWRFWCKTLFHMKYCDSFCNAITVITWNMCPSPTFWVQMLFLAILRNWHRLKIIVLKTERKYLYYLYQYHHFKVNALSIMTGVDDKYNTFLSIHLGLIVWDNFAKICYTYITCKESCRWKPFTAFVWRWKSS